MNPFHQYLDNQLEDHLKKHCVVVWYDPNSEFEPYIQELPADENTRVRIGSSAVNIARYNGSFIGLRAEVEPLVSEILPDPLLIYLPGVTRDHKSSVLMELEKAGKCYEPQLKRLARNLLRDTMTDGVIDGILAPEQVTYQDIVKALEQGSGDGVVSNLKMVFDKARDSSDLLAQWIIDDSLDHVIEEKKARTELFKLIEMRLGCTIDEDVTLDRARTTVKRYALVAEFRSDLSGEDPPCISMIPAPTVKDQSKRIEDLLSRFRKEQPEKYIEMADQVEVDLGLAQACLSAEHLGRVDTFRLEESLLLRHCGDLVVEGRHQNAMEIVEGRGDSFWVVNDIYRKAQWEVCRLMADLGLAIKVVSAELADIGNDPSAWVEAYCRESAGWYRVDLFQRSLESWLSRMEEDPETEQAVAVMRGRSEELLKKMTRGFTDAFQGASWTIPGCLHQTRIYPDVVEAGKDRTAYIIVDAMRYEMGVDLTRHLHPVEDLSVQPAVAALPTVTPVGMAALLPGASASFSVIEHRGRLAARVEETLLPALNDRLRLLKAQVPDVKELILGKVLQFTTKKLTNEIEGASLVVVRSQEIDIMGEADGGWVARQLMESVLENIARAIKKLSAAGIEHFVIIADHGFQFSLRKEEDMRTDHPGGNTVECHRRFWVGRGGSTPPGAVRVTGAELGYQNDLDFIFPVGLGVFKTEGGLSYHHGGISLQELIVPVITFRMPKVETAKKTGLQVSISGCPDIVTNRTFGITLTAAGDLFQKEPLSLKVILVSGVEQVGRAGMASGECFDRDSGQLKLKPGSQVSVGLILTREGSESCRVVVQDAETDAVLAQSDELPIKLGI